MLLVIHNLPLNTRFADVKSLLLEKCGLQDLILDKLILEDNAKRITVGLPTEEDAAFLVRKINGLYLKGHQLYVQDLRQKPSEQPYRLPNPSNQQNYTQKDWNTSQQQNRNTSQQHNRNTSQQQNRNTSQQQNRNTNQQQDWNTNQQQDWNTNQQQDWNTNQQQDWNTNQQQGWNDMSQQNWKNPSQNRSNESLRNTNPFLYPKLNQNIQGGYREELKDAAVMWAQQSQQLNAMHDPQSVHYPQNVQYPQQLGQGWSQNNQNLGFEQGGGDYTNSNTSWGESSVPVKSRGRSPLSRQFNDSSRGRSDRCFERNSREHSREYSRPREERFERSQPGNKRRWDDSERRDDDDWRQRPASPPREFRQHHQGRDEGAPQRSSFKTGVKPWADAPKPRFQPSKPRFEGPKSSFQGSKSRFEAQKPGYLGSKSRFEAPKTGYQGSKERFEAPKPFNKNRTFNAPDQKFNKFKPKFNSSYSRPPAANPSLKRSRKKDLETIPWDCFNDNQKEKIIKRNEICRSNVVNRITVDIFNDLGISLDDVDLRKYFTDPVRSRLDKVVGDDKFMRANDKYIKYLDAYKDEKHMVLEEAKQLQKDGVEPKLQKVNIKPVFLKPPLPDFIETSNVSQPKRFKADEVGTAPRPGPSQPSKPVSGKIPSYIDGDKTRFKAIKQQHIKDMATLRCPEVGAELDKIVNDEVDNIAKIFHKVIETIPDESQKSFLKGRASVECIDDFKKMFKQKICQRLTNEGVKIVRIYANSRKPPKKAELEPFMRQFGVLALKKSDRKPFFTAHLDSYKTLDKLCNMGNIQIGNSDVVFKPLHMTPKYKRIHISSLNKMRDIYVLNQIREPDVNILEKDWEIKLSAIKEKEEILKQEKAAADAAKEQIRKQEAARDAEINPAVKAENGDVNSENREVKLENDTQQENDALTQENNNVELENSKVKPENNEVIPENHNAVHTDKYGELHSNFDVIDEVHGSDTENYQNKDGFSEEAPGKSDESILRDFPVCSDREIIFDDDDDDSEGDDDQAIAENIDLDNIDENDLEDY